MRTRLFDVLPLRVALVWGLLPGAGLSLVMVLLYGRPLGILGGIYTFLGFWAWWTLSFGVLFRVVSGAIWVVGEWRRDRQLREKPRRRGY
jgi:hypothetical protein